ncbi:MAG TPA: hypothetical protein VN963_04665 [bacterium]|nr:hypothetical protein [bacterium]
MVQWLKQRFQIIQLTLQNPKLIVVFVVLLLGPFLSALLRSPQLSTLTPWYGWVIGWLAFLWFASIEYSLERKKVFDQTSSAFFRAYLDSLIQQGYHLFNYSEEKDFYSKINDWQHQVIQGIAIGLGPRASEKYFHEMDRKNQPVGKTDQQALTLRTSDALCKILQDNIEELNRMRDELSETKGDGKDGLDAGKDVKLLGESKP